MPGPRSPAHEDRDRRLEGGPGQVLTEAGRKELAEHGPSHDDQHQGRGRRRSVADETADTDPDDCNQAHRQGSEDQGLKDTGMSRTIRRGACR